MVMLSFFRFSNSLSKEPRLLDKYWSCLWVRSASFSLLCHFLWRPFLDSILLLSIQFPFLSASCPFSSGYLQVSLIAGNVCTRTGLPLWDPTVNKTRQFKLVRVLSLLYLLRRRRRRLRRERTVSPYGRTTGWKKCRSNRF